jgi:cytochrome c556
MMIKFLAMTIMFFMGSGVIVYQLQDPASPTKAQQDQEQEKEVKPKALDNTPFMMRKLDAARNIVSGLALEDHELIAKSASDLSLLSLESQWEVFQTDYYIRMSNEFRDSAMRLRDAAHEKNLDGATLAYFEVTLNCVRCHKYIRTNPQ